MANFPNEIDLRMFQPASPPKSPAKEIQKSRENSTISRPKSSQPRVEVPAPSTPAVKFQNQDDQLKFPPVVNDKLEEVTSEKPSTANEIISHAHAFDSHNHAELSHAQSHVTTDADKYLFTRLTIKVILLMLQIKIQGIAIEIMPIQMTFRHLQGIAAKRLYHLIALIGNTL